jgi:hypothetical protein
MSELPRLNSFGPRNRKRVREFLMKHPSKMLAAAFAMRMLANLAFWLKRGSAKDIEREAKSARIFLGMVRGFRYGALIAVAAFCVGELEKAALKRKGLKDPLGPYARPSRLSFQRKSA